MFSAAAAVLALLAIPFGEISSIPGTEPIEPLFNNADLVCLCVVRALDQSGTERQQVSARIEIRDTYKAQEPSPVTIIVEYDQVVRVGAMTPGPRPRLVVGETVLLFLKSGDRVYSLVDSPSSVTPLEHLPHVPSKVGLAKLQTALAEALPELDRRDRIRALRLLEGFTSIDSNSQAHVQPFTNSADPELAFAALGVLVAAKVPMSVDRVRSYLDSYQSEVQPFALLSVGAHLGQIDDRQALPSLQILSASRFLTVRLGAMDAIRRIGDPTAIPTLVAKLDDADSTVRYLAVISLAEILGKSGDYAPTMNVFDREPSLSVGLWKQWWADEGKRSFAAKAPRVQ